MPVHNISIVKVVLCEMCGICVSAEQRRHNIIYSFRECASRPVHSLHFFILLFILTLLLQLM